MVVASLSEAAAEAIGADAMVCRVSSYFHDIGKLNKPDYFVENQGDENPHDGLTPTMSALIIVAHVKDGVDMAIKALTWMVKIFEPPVYCYHEIVHNRFVVEAFEAAGVVFVDSIDDVPQGSPIRRSAHGSAPEVVTAALAEVATQTADKMLKFCPALGVRAESSPFLVTLGAWNPPAG